MKSRYMIYGCVDNGTPNVDVFYITSDKEDAIQTFKLLKRLQETDEPEQLEEFQGIYQELQEKGISLFSEDEWIDDLPVDFEITELVEIREVIK